LESNIEIEVKGDVA